MLHCRVTQYDPGLGEQVFIEKINVNGEKIIEQEQIILSQKDALAHNLLELEELKKVQSQVVIQTNTIIDSVFIPFDDICMGVPILFE